MGRLEFASEDSSEIEYAPWKLVRGWGLTPRLFQALVDSPSSLIPAKTAAFVPTIHHHIEAVAPRKQVMAEYWRPVVVERSDGQERVLHVDPLMIRKFRREIADELRGVQEKRRRMAKRLEALRSKLPTNNEDRMTSLRREIEAAALRETEPMVHPIPLSAKILHVAIETTTEMVQLSLVCARLREELPALLRNAEVQYLTLTALTASFSSSSAAASRKQPKTGEFQQGILSPSNSSPNGDAGDDEEDGLDSGSHQRTTNTLAFSNSSNLSNRQESLQSSRLLVSPSELQHEDDCTQASECSPSSSQRVPEALEEPLNMNDPESWDIIDEWLDKLCGFADPENRPGSKKKGAKAAYPQPLRVAPYLRRITRADAMGPGGGALLLLLASPPFDVDDAVERIRRSDLVLQCVGILGSAPDDPEPAMDKLVQAGPLGSTSHLYFGPTYWKRFRIVQERMLRSLEHAQAAATQEGSPKEDCGGPAADSSIFEIRLLERVLRECYSEEQQCERELVCANRVLDRSLVSSDDVLAVLRRSEEEAPSPEKANGKGASPAAAAAGGGGGGGGR